MSAPISLLSVKALQDRRRRGGLEFGREAREFTPAEFLLLFATGLAAVMALAAIVADPLLEVRVIEDGEPRPVTDEEMAELTAFLEAEVARVDADDPPNELAAEAAAAAEAERVAAEAAAKTKDPEPAKGQGEKPAKPAKAKQG